MKYLGLAVLIASTSLTGWYFSTRDKLRELTCRELLSFCTLLKADLVSKKSSPLKLLENNSFKYLSFIGGENIKTKSEIKSCLSDEENSELEEFLYSLGKSAEEGQRAIIESFSGYIENALDFYSKRYIQNRRLYLSFGVFSGCVIAIILI